MDPDNKVRGANMGPTWVLSAADWPHVGPMNLTIRVDLVCFDVVCIDGVYPYIPDSLHGHCGHYTVVLVPMNYPWKTWVNPSHVSIENILRI